MSLISIPQNTSHFASVAVTPECIDGLKDEFDITLHLPKAEFASGPTIASVASENPLSEKPARDWSNLTSGTTASLYPNITFFEDSPLEVPKAIARPRSYIDFSKAECASLVEQAKLYFRSNPAPLPVDFTFKAEETDKEILASVYKEYQGLCIGEAHDHVSPKKFLIDNMETLRDLGVKTIFYEGLLYDEHQSLLDLYFDTPDAEIPILLQTLLEDRSDQYGFQRPYTHLDLLRKAKQCGIRIVGINTSVSTEACGEKQENPFWSRLWAMNFQAPQIIEREKGDGLYIALMGQAHAPTMTKYDKDDSSRIQYRSPGMADLLQCPLINIRDSDRVVPPRVNVADSEYYADSDQPWIQKHIHLKLFRPVKSSEKVTKAECVIS